MTLSAFALILTAAFIHASWNLLAKRAGGGAPFVWAAAVAGTLLFLPISIVLGTFQQVNWNGQTVLFLAGSGLLQTLYFITVQRGYKVGDLSLVYPLARGTGPVRVGKGVVDQREALAHAPHRRQERALLSDQQLERAAVPGRKACGS